MLVEISTGCSPIPGRDPMMSPLLVIPVWKSKNTLNESPFVSWKGVVDIGNRYVHF